MLLTEPGTAPSRRVHSDATWIGADQLPPPASSCVVCVVMPVRDEANRLRRTLQALANQRDLDGRRFDPARFEVIVLANNCRDESATIAREFAQLHPALALHVLEATLPPAEAHVGRARRILMDLAYNRQIGLGHGRGVIASTDGDTVVATNWCAATLHEIACGADAVGGRIVADPLGRRDWERGTLLAFLRDVSYQYLVAEYESYLNPQPGDEWPRHHQHTGASFAVTAQTYGAVGGLPPLPSSEDIALYRALRRVDARIRHSPQVRVVTAARRMGRAPGGMADQLHAWTELSRSSGQQLVVSVAAREVTAVMQRQLRELWSYTRNGSVARDRAAASFADANGLDLLWLREQLCCPQPYGLLLESVEAQRRHVPQPGATPLVPITEAIAELRLKLARLRPARGSTPLEHVETVRFFAPAVQMA